MRDNQQKRRTRRLCAASFFVTLIVLLTGIGLLTVDMVTGQALQGSAYVPPSLPNLSQAVSLLPARWQLLLAIPQGLEDLIRWLFSVL